MRTLIGALAMCATLMLGGCNTNSSGPPELDSSNLTYDGLAKVKNPRAHGAWMRPDFSLDGYTKIMLIGAGIEYRPVKPVQRAAASSASQFPLTAEQKERLRSIVRDAFRTELAQSQKFQLVDEPGPDVLMVWGGLIDVVSFVPPDAVGRSNIYLNSIGEATLVVELRDSESNAVLVRIIDRRAAQAQGPNVRSTSVTNWAEVQQVARTWAGRLREGLEEATTWDR
ncbi:MAG TPA: DUF3313 family protein [Pseudomonadales bacterium]|nr:DUF3313 family protein [Pseudomonadales bacterium]